MIPTLSSITYHVCGQIGRMIGLSGVSVLVYHSISSNTHDPYAISPGQFEAQMKKISQTSQFISAEEVINAHAAGTTRNGVVITFDDGYKSILQVLPTLRKYQIPAVAFVLASPAKANRTELDNEEPLLTPNELKQLLTSGVTIGVHSGTHKNFATLSPKEITAEVIDAKKTLEKTIHQRVKYFAYPKGRYTPDVVQAVKRAGYTAAFAVAHKCVTAEDSIYTIPRMIIDSSYTPAQFPDRISPGMQAVRNLL